MSTWPGLFPPLPNDTARAAAALHGKSIYLTIGDQVEQLLADIDLARLDPSGERSASTLALLALVTIFQFVENLPDRQAAEATRTHLDWKYTLHLPVAYPGLDSQALCRFRQHLLDDFETLPTFQQAIDRLAEFGLLRSTDQERPEALEVLVAVCTVSCLEQLAEAMHMILEALVASQPEWLRAMTLPHWYERYNQMLTTRSCQNRERNKLRSRRRSGPMLGIYLTPSPRPTTTAIWLYCQRHKPCARYGTDNSASHYIRSNGACRPVFLA